MQLMIISIILKHVVKGLCPGNVIQWKTEIHVLNEGTFNYLTPERVH